MDMRADRLLSMLMILQTRGRVTSNQLADELEVSERTIYRDIMALNIAGVPVYTERGPGGGISLLDSYRTTLTGLNEDEVRALFMLSIPSPLTDLGVSKELKAALLKLSASLPSSRREAEERARQRVHLDWQGWFEEREQVPYLQIINQAIWGDKKLSLSYRLVLDIQVERVVEPLGLVAKANSWYLVYQRDGHIRVLKVSQILEAQIQAEGFERPEDFDLATFWGRWCQNYEANRPSTLMKLRITPGLIPFLPRIFGNQIQEEVSTVLPDADGWISVTVDFESVEMARSRILGLGSAVEVLEPEALRLAVLDFAEQIVAAYTD